MYSTDLHSTPENASEQIASNASYELKIDKAKNRIYFTVHGYWKNKEVVSELIEDWKKAVSLTQANFTVLTDMRSMITHPQELNEIHLEAQKLVIQAGVKQVANVLPTDKIANLQANSIVSNTTLPYRNFNSCEEAEDFLNQSSTAYIN
ncbi:hypothetical protein [Pontibacter pudoricolor]|uniref:hypothetical protein n=1 Tax=Pontibacter pudoricolor TaxID=2694930 RepID=UPI0013913408|nr:hypothetical protein [Pontibacter pudoricolor]